ARRLLNHVGRSDNAVKLSRIASTTALITYKLKAGFRLVITQTAESSARFPSAAQLPFFYTEILRLSARPHAAYPSRIPRNAPSRNRLPPSPHTPQSQSLAGPRSGQHRAAQVDTL